VDRSSSELGPQTLGEAFASFAPSVRLETEGKVTLVMASHGLNSLQSFDRAIVGILWRRGCAAGQEETMAPACIRNLLPAWVKMRELVEMRSETVVPHS